MRTSVIIGGQEARKGDTVLIRENKFIGQIRDIGNCGLVALIAPGYPEIMGRPYEPSELEVLGKEGDRILG